MIHKVEQFVQEDPDSEKFPLKQIERLSSVDGDQRRFVGRVTLGLQTPLGLQQIPVSFEIQADSIEQAFEKFEEAAQPQIEQARSEIEDQLQQIRRDASSRIIRPDEVGGRMIDLGQIKRK